MLIATATDGDEVALTALIQRHVDMAYRIALRITGGRDDAEDAVAQAFVNAWSVLGSFREGGSFRAWLGRIVRNTAIDVVRKRRDMPFSAFAPETHDGEEHPEPFVVVDDAPSPEEEAIRNEAHKKAHSLLAALSQDDRELMYLHHSEELTFREIGEVLNVPLHTIKSRYRRALLRLKKHDTEHAPKHSADTYTNHD